LSAVKIAKQPKKIRINLSGKKNVTSSADANFFGGSMVLDLILNPHWDGQQWSECQWQNGCDSASKEHNL